MERTPRFASQGLLLVAALGLGLASPARADDAMDAGAINARLHQQLQGQDPPAPAQVPGQSEDRPYLVSGEITSAEVRALLQAQLEATSSQTVSFGKPTAAIGLDIRFEKNSAELTEQAKTDLCQVGESIKSDDFVNLRFELGGHADSDGTEEVNDLISKSRADAARAHLTSACGVGPERVVATGYGTRDPLVEERGLEENKRKNRRVDLRILRD